jgi:hypothetical protein
MSSLGLSEQQSYYSHTHRQGFGLSVGRPIVALADLLAAKMDTEKSQVDFRTQAWQYFELHASQRLTTFNYYIVISTLITTGIFATFSKDYTAPSLGIAGGLLLLFFSFVFWKLDDRNKQIIKGAEAALKFFETRSDLVDPADGPNVLKLFTRDDFLTDRRKAARTWPWNKHYSYTTSFNWVFRAFGIFGLLAVAFSALKSQRLGSIVTNLMITVRMHLSTYNFGFDIYSFILGLAIGIFGFYVVARLVRRIRPKRPS